MQEEQDTESGHELKMLNFPEHFTFYFLSILTQG